MIFPLDNGSPREQLYLLSAATVGCVCKMTLRNLSIPSAFP